MILAHYVRCFHCHLITREMVSGALLNRVCNRCGEGRLTRYHYPSTDHPDPFTSCKPPSGPGTFRTRNKDVFSPRDT